MLEAPPCSRLRHARGSPAVLACCLPWSLPARRMRRSRLSDSQRCFLARTAAPPPRLTGYSPRAWLCDARARVQTAVEEHETLMRTMLKEHTLRRRLVHLLNCVRIGVKSLKLANDLWRLVSAEDEPQSSRDKASAPGSRSGAGILMGGGGGGAGGVSGGIGGVGSGGIGGGMGLLGAGGAGVGATDGGGGLALSPAVREAWTQLSKLTGATKVQCPSIGAHIHAAALLSPALFSALPHACTVHLMQPCRSPFIRLLAPVQAVCRPWRAAWLRMSLLLEWRRSLSSPPSTRRRACRSGLHPQCTWLANGC